MVGVLLSSILVMVVLVMKPAGLFRRWQEEYTYLMIGFSANAVGAVVALLVNDSGIVAAATMIIFVAVPMLLFRIQELHENNKGSYLDKASHSV